MNQQYQDEHFVLQHVLSVADSSSNRGRVIFPSHPLTLAIPGLLSDQRSDNLSDRQDLAPV